MLRWGIIAARGEKGLTVAVISSGCPIGGGVVFYSADVVAEGAAEVGLADFPGHLNRCSLATRFCKPCFLAAP
jgi:hypothetical protein